MDLSKAQLGEEYRIFVDASGNLSGIPSMDTLIATVIATKKKGMSSNDLILGWRADQKHPTDVTERKNPSTENDYVPNQALFTYGKAVKRTMLVAVHIINGLDGFPCKKCSTFYPQALPNQKDGSLICWSCRNRW